MVVLSRRFLVDNASFLAAGAALTFASSFGQTFFIALFAGHYRSEFSLSNGEWGGLYTLATLGSAIVLIYAGKFADRFRIRALAVMVIALYGLTIVGMAVASSALMLGLAIFGLRFCGQGMMSHLAMTAMARWFAARRGQAIAVASMGQSAGEAVIPVVTVLLMTAIGWRQTWLVCAAILVLVLAPLIIVLLRLERTPQSIVAGASSAGMDGRQWSRREALHNPFFWALLPGTMAPPFIGTSVFFHQVHLAEVKGWQLSQFAAAYPAFSIGTIALTLVAGWAVDRWSAVQILPVYLLPLIAGLMILISTDQILVLPIAMAFFGMSVGGGHALIGAMWPELYGTKNLGAIRALAISGMVFASALGPGVTGYLIDFGIAFQRQCLFMAAFLLLASIGFTLLVPRIQARRQEPSNPIG